MSKLQDIDTARVSPCPGCGVDVRRFSSTPVAGSGLDLVFSGPWWCDWCIKAGVPYLMRMGVVLALMGAG